MYSILLLFFSRIIWFLIKSFAIVLFHVISCELIYTYIRFLWFVLIIFYFIFILAEKDSSLKGVKKHNFRSACVFELEYCIAVNVSFFLHCRFVSFWFSIYGVFFYIVHCFIIWHFIMFAYRYMSFFDFISYIIMLYRTMFYSRFWTIFVECSFYCTIFIWCQYDIDDIW